MLINSRPVKRTGPEVPKEASSLPVPPPPPRPVINFTTNLRSPHHAGCEHFTPALAHASSLDTDLTRNTRAPHFTPQHWLLCHMELY